MKIFILSFSICLSLTLFSQNNWTLVNTPPSQNAITKIVFVNDSLAYGISLNKILKTTDEGNNWMIGHSYSSNIYLSNLYLLDDSVHFVLINGDTTFTFSIHQNSNSFNGSIKQKLGINNRLFESSLVVFKDSLWGNDSSGLYVKSQNGNSRQIMSGMIYNRPSLTIWNNKFLATSTENSFKLSNDSGVTWIQGSTYPIHLRNYAHKLINLGGDTLLYKLGGFPNIFYKSYDRGVSWISAEHPTSPIKVSQIFPHNTSVNLFGIKGNRVLISKNLGRDYMMEDTLNHSIIEIYQKNDSIFFALCANGSIYKSTNAGGLVSLKKQEKKNNVFNIYPNPTKEVLNIYYASNHNKVDWLKIIDQKGKLVYHTSTPIKRINVKDFEAGVYFIEIGLEERKVVQKFIKQ